MFSNASSKVCWYRLPWGDDIPLKINKCYGEKWKIVNNFKADWSNKLQFFFWVWEYFDEGRKILNSFFDEPQQSKKRRRNKLPTAVSINMINFEPYFNYIKQQSSSFWFYLLRLGNHLTFTWNLLSFVVRRESGKALWFMTFSFFVAKKSSNRKREGIYNARKVFIATRFYDKWIFLWASYGCFSYLCYLSGSVSHLRLHESLSNTKKLCSWIEFFFLFCLSPFFKRNVVFLLCRVFSWWLHCRFKSNSSGSTKILMRSCIIQGWLRVFFFSKWQKKSFGMEIPNKLLPFDRVDGSFD